MRLTLLLGLAVSSTACGKLIGLDDPLNGQVNGDFCYGTGMVHVCFSQEPTGTDVPVIYDTSVQGCNNNVISGGDGLCVIGQTSFTIPSGMTVTANGAATASIPLVLIATDSITIDGTLDGAAQHQSFSSPAGSDFSGCSSGTAPSGSGGGQGGSFIALGGNGGSASGAGGVAGTALPPPTMVHGGCPGRAGASAGGNGGHGGGAIYLIANTSIAISGRVDASGAGGSTSNDLTLLGTPGGSGGGAGGMIGLDAPSVSITGAVCAIGGSGGGGSSGTQSSSGGDASGGSTACTVGMPGSAGSGAGSGGAGATNGAGAAGNPGSSGGGGGGGGSSGFIRIYSTHTGSGAIAPTPIQGT